MSSAPAQPTGKKRKAATISSADRKRQKTQNIRDIPVQSKDAAVSATGELDVAAFVKAREYEINALEKSMQRSRKGLTMRAFQQVPRALRRRTASHNVKKVPRRLRRRAEKEVSGVQEEDTEIHLLGSRG
jgi:ribonuclease P/MRP protein subunit POP1